MQRHTSFALIFAGGRVSVKFAPAAIVDLAGLHVDGFREGHVLSGRGDATLVPQASQRRRRGSEKGESNVLGFGEHDERRKQQT